MKNAWFFIANPKKAKWEDIKKPYWKKHYGEYNWGIPNKSRDIKLLGQVEVDDLIICYVTGNKKIIGWCKCTLRRYSGDIIKENVDPNFINRIGISEINHFKNPIKLEDLKNEAFHFIEEYLEIPLGRSIVEVSKNDWHKFKDKFCKHETISPSSFSPASAKK